MAHEFPERSQDAIGRKENQMPPSGLALWQGGEGGRGAIGRFGSATLSSPSSLSPGGNWTLEHFLRHPTAVRAKLLKAEVVALR
jgi:hypothetical protein